MSDENDERIDNKTGTDLNNTEDASPPDHKFRTSRGQTNWLDDPGNSSTLRQSSIRQSPRPISDGTSPAERENLSPCNGLKFGVYGWRKRCLYSLVLVLMIIAILNIALTLWLLKVMEFSFDGIGSLKVVPGGIELRGQAAILDALIASSVRSRRGSNLVLESWGNFTASARSQDGRVLARFTLSEDKMSCMSRDFRITDPRGELLFSANKDQVVVGAETLRVTGVGGAVFKGSVQTPMVRAESGRDLRLESATRSLEVRASQRIVLDSFGGEIHASCLSDLTLQSVEGAITLHSKSVFLKGLKVALPVQGHLSREQPQQFSGRGGHQNQRGIYQLCACENGKLFLANPEGSCQADTIVCQ